MSSIGLGIAGAGLAYNVINGVVQNNKADNLQKSLKDPVYAIPQEFYENRAIARQMAQVGLPQQQYNNAVNGINQNNASAIAAASKTNNPGAAISSITRQSDNANAALTAEDAQARESNQRYFMQQNSALGNQELAKQQNDVYDKYTRDFNQMQAYRGAGQQNINNAITGASQLGMTYLNYNNNNPAQQTFAQRDGTPTLAAGSPRTQVPITPYAPYQIPYAQQPGIPAPDNFNYYPKI